jgi:hypothetical protein
VNKTQVTKCSDFGQDALSKKDEEVRECG